MILESSFRDPSGFLFIENGKLLRQINPYYKKDYEFFMQSGLYEKLCGKNLLIPHSEIVNHKGHHQPCFKVIEPELVEFISYPYEWSFSQLQDAALATLRIQKIALQFGMTLKDASAYNIQFKKGRPVFIDTLSFEIYKEGQPWDAYRQFCQHFLAPLTLMSYTDIRMNQMLKCYIDGLPLDLSSRLLPFRTKLNFSILMHIHLHAKTQKKYENKGSASRNIQIKKSNLIALIEGLIDVISKLNLKKQKTEWGEYYTFTNYGDNSFLHKKKIIEGFLKKIDSKSLWDLGANTGEFTRVANQLGINCVAFDIDPIAVEVNYQYIKQHKITNILPLVLDLTNPSPSIGWSNEERMSIMNRSHPDTILALALIHHLAISNNLPFNKISEFLSKLCDNLIIEFVPKSDSQVKILLTSRTDIFGAYDEESFVREFEVFFYIRAKEKIIDSERTIYLMERK